MKLDEEADEAHYGEAEAGAQCYLGELAPVRLGAPFQKRSEAPIRHQK